VSWPRHLPAPLADIGSGAALGAQARNAPIPVAVEAGGIGRYPQEIKAAVYFCALEALRSAARHADTGRASVRLSVPTAGSGSKSPAAAGDPRPVTGRWG
jgi:hypothetical protein